jgi:hypothetical protein
MVAAAAVAVAVTVVEIAAAVDTVAVIATVETVAVDTIGINLFNQLIHKSVPFFGTDFFYF